MGTILKAIGVFTICLVGGCTILAAIGGNAARQEVQRQDANAIPLSAFQAVQNGMSYAQVRDLFGRDGQVTSENTFPDFQGGQTHTILYKWDAGFAASISVMFQNDAVMQKSQFGLK